MAAAKKNSKPVQTDLHRFMAFAPKKTINRFKPVQTDIRTLAHENTTTTRKRKAVQTGSQRFMAFAQNERKPVQTGSHRFMAFAKKT